MTTKAYTDLTCALSIMLDKLNDVFVKNNYNGPSIKMFIAGGMAVNYWCGSRYTSDVDASFSNKKIQIPFDEMVVSYKGPDGNPSSIYLDPTYNNSYAIMHDDFEDDAVEWVDIGNEKRIVKMYVLSPVDLALSKLSRFHDQDRLDIQELAKHNLIDVASLTARAKYAIVGYVGNLSRLESTIKIVCKDITEIQQKQLEMENSNKSISRGIGL